MAKSKRVAGLILLAALDFKEGNRRQAALNLQRASEDPDFEDTLDGLNGDAEGDDPFLTAGDDDFSDLDLDIGRDDDEESASLVRGGKAKKPAAKKPVKADTDIEDGDSPGDADNDNDETLRPEVARAKQIRANLKALASVK